MPRWIALTLLCAACMNESDRELDVPCDNVGYAIASRTLACSGDPALANARYERFAASTKCAATNNADTHFDCARSVNARPCADVDALGDDLDAWIRTSSACPALFGVSP